MFDNMNFDRQGLYNRKNAVDYALKYALHPNTAYRYFPLINDNSGDCANFISQCLRAGGAPFDFNTDYPWWYDNNGTINRDDDKWSICWTIANSLYWFLKVNQENKSSYIKGQEIDIVNRLEPGDLIFYEDNKGLIFHSAIITAFSNIPLVSHHSYEARNIPYYKSYPFKKVHFIKISL